MLVTLIRSMDITSIVWLLITVLKMRLPITYNALFLRSSVSLMELQFLILHQPWLLDHLLLPNTGWLTKMQSDNTCLSLSCSSYGSTNLRLWLGRRDKRLLYCNLRDLRLTYNRQRWYLRHNHNSICSGNIRHRLGWLHWIYNPWLLRQYWYPTTGCNSSLT